MTWFRAWLLCFQGLRRRISVYQGVKSGPKSGLWTILDRILDLNDADLPSFESLVFPRGVWTRLRCQFNGDLGLLVVETDSGFRHRRKQRYGLVDACQISVFAKTML